MVSSLSGVMAINIGRQDKSRDKRRIVAYDIASTMMVVWCAPEDGKNKIENLFNHK